MQLILDFSAARMGSCHSYTGVMASISEEKPTSITITHDGCHVGTLNSQTTKCEDPTIDDQQAWSVAMLLTGRESIRPIGKGSWDPEIKRMTFPLKSGTRPRVT